MPSSQNTIIDVEKDKISPAIEFSAPTSMEESFSTITTQGEEINCIVGKNVLKSVLDVKSIFGNDVYEKCLVDGHVNYMKLADVLLKSGNPELVLKFEQILDEFNRKRQFELELGLQNIQIELNNQKIFGFNEPESNNEKNRINAPRMIKDDPASRFGQSKGRSNHKLRDLVLLWSDHLTKILEHQMTLHTRAKSRRNHNTKEVAESQDSKHIFGQYISMIQELGANTVANVVAMELATHVLLSLQNTNHMASSLPTSSPVSLTHLSRKVGKSVEQAYLQKGLQETIQRLKKDKQKHLKQKDPQHESNTTQTNAKKEIDPARVQFVEIAQQFSVKGTTQKLLYPKSSKHYKWAMSKLSSMSSLQSIQLGATLISLALTACKFPVKVDKTEQHEYETSSHSNNVVWKPAFWHTFQIYKSKSIGVLKVNDFLIEYLLPKQNNKENSKNFSSDGNAIVSPLDSMIINKVPAMFVPPSPWTSDNKGGYWYSKQSLLSIPKDQAPEVHAYLQQAISSGYLDKYLNALNKLAQTPWAVNYKILKVIKSIWDKGESFLDIPSDVSNKEPEDLSNLDRYELRRRKVAEYNERNLRIGLGYILQQASYWATHGDRFYFPHMIDFRGRVYPKSSSGFVHTGPDHVRALFQFWNGRKLGKDGLRWLKIQLATTFGVDKSSFNDRVKFVDENYPRIAKVAHDPLGVKFQEYHAQNSSISLDEQEELKYKEDCLWWTQAEEPFQMLAACFELVEAVESNDVENYVSRLPIMQDGSCNGLQHYAALGRDIEGGIEVNVVPSTLLDPQSKSSGEILSGHMLKPRDVYSKVKSLVEQLTQQDIEALENYKGGRKGPKFKEVYENGTMAKEILPYVSRKVVKRPVMTSVYGATFYGMTLQIYDVLKRDQQLVKDIETKNSAAKVSNLKMRESIQYIQNSEDLEDEELMEHENFETVDTIERQLKQYSRYLASKVIESYNILFGNAKKIQKWLEESAEKIIESVRWDNYIFSDEQHQFDLNLENITDTEERELIKLNVSGSLPFDFLLPGRLVTSVIWTTPLGLPVVQPYRLETPVSLVSSSDNESSTPSNIQIVRTGIQDMIISNPFTLTFVNKQRQINGIAPNYIHSLDSTHLLMTVLKFFNEEISTNSLYTKKEQSSGNDSLLQYPPSFASVHDSYWTHASSVDKMNKILRQTFVDVHTPNLIQSLYEEFKERYDGYLSVAYIEKNSPAGKEISTLREKRRNIISKWMTKEKEEENPNIGNTKRIINKELEIIENGSNNKKPITKKQTLKNELTDLKYEMKMEYVNWKRIKSKSEKPLYITPSMIIKKHNQPVYKKDPSSSSSSKSQEMIRVFMPLEISPIPSRGTLDINQVKNSTYFFS